MNRSSFRRLACALLTFAPALIGCGNPSNYEEVQGVEDAREFRDSATAVPRVQCYGPGVTDETLEILGNTPGMENLWLRGCSNITPAGIEALFQQTDLRSLAILGCGGLTSKDAVLPGLDSQVNLETLQVHDVRLKRDDFEAIARLGSLRVLHLQDQKLSRHAVDTLGAMTQLTKLNLRECSGMSDREAQDLVDSLPETRVRLEHSRH